MKNLDDRDIDFIQQEIIRPLMLRGGGRKVTVLIQLLNEYQHMKKKLSPAYAKKVEAKQKERDETRQAADLGEQVKEKSDNLRQLRRKPVGAKPSDG